MVITSIPLIKKRYPDLLIICDVCLCPYTDHGHCGVLKDDGSMEFDFERSKERIAEIATAYATAGADIVAPSDMMQGRIKNICEHLKAAGLREKVLFF